MDCVNTVHTSRSSSVLGNAMVWHRWTMRRYILIVFENSLKLLRIELPAQTCVSPHAVGIFMPCAQHDGAVGNPDSCNIVIIVSRSLCMVTFMFGPSPIMPSAWHVSDTSCIGITCGTALTSFMRPRLPLAAPSWLVILPLYTHPTRPLSFRF